MLGFRRLDYVDSTDFLYVLGITCLFLCAVYWALKFAKPYFLNQLVKKKESNIQVDEIRYVPNVGHICVLTVKQQSFVTISNKAGVGIAPLLNDINNKDIVSNEVNTGQELV